MKFNKFHIPFFLLLLTIGVSACVTGKSVKLSKTQSITFLDSLQASQAIINDQFGYFENVNKLDMSLQMKQNFPKSDNRKNILQEYKLYQQKDVKKFDNKEKQKIKQAIKTAYDEVQKVGEGIFPENMNLIRAKGDLHGEMAFFTRENHIVIPGKDILNMPDENLHDILLHEIFHIWSRYNPRKKRILYGLIGFKNMFGLPIIMDKPLKDKVLLNPDGMDIAQVITLKTDSSNFSAIPLIVSNRDAFDEKQTDYFSYFKFDLYQVVKKGKAIRVISNEDGSSQLNYKDYPNFFEQIKDNTKYIIHPDEILADNFVILAKSKSNPELLKKYSVDGRELLSSIEKILRE